MKDKRKNVQRATPRGRKREWRPLWFFALLLLAALAELLPDAAYAAALGGGASAASLRLLRAVAVLLPSVAALLLLLVFSGRGRALRLPSLPPRGARTAMLLLLLVALNNFPFYAWLRGHAVFRVEGGLLCLYTLATLLTAMAEELLFRGILFPAVHGWLATRAARKRSSAPAREADFAGEAAPAREADFAGEAAPAREADFAGEAAPPREEALRKRQSLLLSIGLSSFLFGLAHAANLLGGASFPETLLQIGYSTLVGAAACLLYLAADSLWLSVLFHFIYNFGGLFLATFGEGELRLPHVILTTAVLSLLAVGASAYAFFQLVQEKEASVE